MPLLSHFTISASEDLTWLQAAKLTINTRAPGTAGDGVFGMGAGIEHSFLPTWPKQVSLGQT